MIHTGGEPLPEFAAGNVSRWAFVADKASRPPAKGETAHELLHRDIRPDSDHAKRPVAFVVSTAIGLDLNTSSADLIQI